MGSVVFDRAADYYDETRRLLPATQEALMGHLAAEVRGRGRCLEVGVGTGRIALDLHRLGVPMAGIDLSRAMLRKLVDKAGGRPPFPIAVADATVLPVADNRVGAAVVCHVLHLIGHWQVAVEELVRVVRPGGVILVETARHEGDAIREVDRHFWSVASPAGRPRRGMERIAELDELLAALGFRARDLPSVEEVVEVTLEDLIATREAGQSSSCWVLEDDVRRSAAAATRAWAEANGLALDTPRRMAQTITWRAYDAPAAPRLD